MMRKAKDNAEDTIEVRVGRIGGEIKAYELPEDSTVEDALETADVDFQEGMRLRVNGETAAMEDVLEDGDKLTVTGKVKGGTK